MLKRDPITSMPLHLTDSSWSLLGLCVFPTVHPAVCLRGTREDDSKWGLCPLASEELSGEQREQEGGVRVVFLVLSVGVWSSVSGHKATAVLRVACCMDSASSPVLALSPHEPSHWRPGSLSAASLGHLR